MLIKRTRGKAELYFCSVYRKLCYKIYVTKSLSYVEAIKQRASKNVGQKKYYTGI